ncbi:molybdate ABC transporter substrate-binding protein [Ideonella livida]|uniref:Molybdate ABC transporter substrate-binding protein n=1 Tax=Ideonella livida TaxID=2707176 RepID=A0A7C9PJM5_9BURK|nr:molybdate ABC transporter substrate-binding protein [Ideonella livida]NDY93573.1 molybdate ABC transporter substrate-binding protein [Ideonella livida]
MTLLRRVLQALGAMALLLGVCAQAAPLTVAAAADLKFAMEEVVEAFKARQPGAEVAVVYGSSGKFHTQIQQGAPYDLFFSADIALPQSLARAGLAASPVRPYAVGRLVLWSATRDARGMTLASLADPSITRVAIANPRHAPYGQRAEEALRAAGVWEQVAPKLVYGENIAQAAQFVQTGNAQVGVIAQSLALHPELQARGGHALVPEALHSPLAQGFIITRRGQDHPLAVRLAEFMQTPVARGLMLKYGFALPGEAAR